MQNAEFINKLSSLMNTQNWIVEQICRKNIHSCEYVCNFV